MLIESVRSTKGGETATNNEIDSFTRNWLKNASDRSGGREKRRLNSKDQSCSSQDTQTGQGGEEN